MRKDDIAYLISNSNEKINGFKSGDYKPDKVTIKNIFENLRSCLDYCAVDVAESIGIKKNRIYFPYCESREEFEKRVKENLGQLDVLNKEVFDLIEGLQKYKTKYYWLGYLCQSTIELKHKGLLNQFRPNLDKPEPKRNKL